MKKIYKCDYCSKTGKKKKIKKHELVCKHNPNNNLEAHHEYHPALPKCYPVNQRMEDGGWSYVGTCSLCGNRIGLWPYAERACSNCLATVIH